MSSENYVKVTDEKERANLIQRVINSQVSLAVQTSKKEKFEAVPVMLAGDSFVVVGDQVMASEKVVVSFVIEGQPYFFKSEVKMMDDGRGLIPSNKSLFALHRRANFRVSVGVGNGAFYPDVETGMSIVNVSLGGMKLVVSEELDFVQVGKLLTGKLEFQGVSDSSAAVIVRFKKVADGSTTLGVEFDRLSAAVRSKVNQFILNACRYDFYSS